MMFGVMTLCKRVGECVILKSSSEYWYVVGDYFYAMDLL